MRRSVPKMEAKVDRALMVSSIRVNTLEVDPRGRLWEVPDWSAKSSVCIPYEAGFVEGFVYFNAVFIVMLSDVYLHAPHPHSRRISLTLSI